MRFLIDENVPLLVATALRQLARAERRVLVTFDSDFARLIFRDWKPAPPGIVYMRSRPEHAKLVAEFFVALFRAGKIDPISNFVTIDAGGIVRTMPLEQNDNG